MAALFNVGIEVDLRPARKLESMTARRRVTLKAVRAGAKLVIPAARSRAPRRKGSGALKSAMGVKAEKGRRGKTVALAVIGARKRVMKMVPRGNKTVKAVPAFYQHLVEKGTQGHSLGKGAKIDRKGRKGFTIGQGGGRRHPGAKPKPHLGPAWQATKGRVGQTVTRVIADEVKKEIAKAAAKARGTRK